MTLPAGAVAVALAAAVMHATWTLLLARAEDSEAATVVALCAAVLLFAPVARGPFPPEALDDAHQQATHDLLFELLPPRRLRANPRVVERKMSKLRRQARRTPQPATAN